MKFLIVLSLLCVAVNALSDDDVLVERLLRRYEENQQQKRITAEEEAAAQLALIANCQEDVHANFDYYTGKDDEAGYAATDLALMVDACVACGSVSVTTARLVSCTEALAAANPPDTGRRALFGREAPVGNCVAASVDLNNLVNGEDHLNKAADEAILEDICDKAGGVHFVLEDLAACVTP